MNVASFAQIPKGTFASLNELKRGILKAHLERAIAKRSISLPPLMPKTVKYPGKNLVFLPPNQLIDRIRLLEQQNLPIIKIHQYVKDIEPYFDNRENFFEILANTYYKNHFKVFTPNMDSLFKKVASLNNPALEKRVLTRIQKLIENRPFLAAKFRGIDPERAIRIRYANDAQTLTAENFEEDDLLLSVEQNLRASTQKTLCRHIRGNSTFSVGKKQPQLFHIYDYKGPTEYLPLLYRYLVNADDYQMDMYLVHDTNIKTLLLYNYDLSTWMRISPHEYKDADNLHLHIHKRIKTEIIVNQRPHIEEVLINISIPLSSSLAHFDVTQEDLYNLFIVKPVQQMKANHHIHIIER